MKFFTTIILLVITALSVVGHNLSDSISVYFSLNKAEFNPDFNNDYAAIDSFIVKIDETLTARHLDSLVIYGFTSPDGPLSLHSQLAAARAQVIADYIIENSRVPGELVKTYPVGIAWNRLRQLVDENQQTPARDQILEILDNPALYYYNSRGQLVDKRKEALMSLDDFVPYQWMIDNLFPMLRYGMAVTLFSSSDNDEHSVADYDKFVDSQSVDSLQSKYASELSAIDAKHSYLPRHLLALKTNLLYYAALMPNLELEYLFNDHWSVAVEGNIAWWGNSSKNKSYRLAMFDAEGRWWINPRSPWHGMFLGVFAGGGYYDLAKDAKKGYYGDGYMTGLSIGYMWPVSRNLSFEAAVGAGYMHTRYKEYRAYEGHHLYEGTKELNYFGPLKLKFSLVWRFLDNNRKKPDIIEAYE